MKRILVVFAVLLLAASAVRTQSTFEQFQYSPAPIRIQQLGVEVKNGARIRDIRFAAGKGAPIAAYLVEPAAGCRSCAAILFVHWYEPKAANSNRTEFLDEAEELARHGCVSLLVDAMWSRPDWFATRDPANDYVATVNQVKNLRRSLDVLLSQPRIDAARTAYVGHDFGMMFGAVLAGVDHRIHALVLMAGTEYFSDWYLLGRKVSDKDRDEAVDRMMPLSPTLYLAQADAPVLLQFGRNDPYVPAAKAQSVIVAASQPKTVRFYDSGHALNDAARADRLKWLEQTLVLP